MSSGSSALKVKDLLAFIQGRTHDRLPRWFGENVTLRRMWIRWLREYNGPGHYRRKTATTSARAVYMRLHSPRALAWLALLAGEEEVLVLSALDDSKMESSRPASAGVFRRHVPWDRIEPLIKDRVRPVQTPAELRKAILHLPKAGPESERFTRAWKRRGDGQKERRDVWYTDQKEHWLGWLGDYDGPGAYGRLSRGASAEQVFNRVVNPQMLTWLAETSGVPSSLVRRAVRAALRQRSMAAMSAAIRRIIPWAVVHGWLTQKRKDATVRKPQPTLNAESR